MAVWYDKNGPGGDMTKILDPRQHTGRALGFADQPWTECRIGAFVSATSAADDNGAWTQEDIAVSSVYDRWMFGIKNSEFPNTAIGQDDCDFWGVSGVIGSTTRIPTSGFLTTESGVADRTRYFCASGTTVNGTTPAVNSSGNLYEFSSTANAVATTNYARFLGLQIIISNRGTSTQTVEFYMSKNAGTAVTDTSEPALRTLLTNFNSHRFATSSGAVTANDGAAAFPIPDAIYFRFPFISTRLRIHNVMAMQIAP